MTTVSLVEARRLALVAQGFHRPRASGRVDVRLLRRVIEHTGIVQLDFVDAVAPAHHLVFFSRIGPFEPDRLDDFIYVKREVTEQWAHQACLVPVDEWPLLVSLHTEGTDRRVRALHEFAAQQPAYLERVLAEVRDRGPLAPTDLPDPERAVARTDWGWTAPRIALEALLLRGEVAVAHRRDDLMRVFDLAARVIPERYVTQTVPREEAQRRLMERAARAHGIGIAADLADYYQIPVAEADARLRELVDAGTLEEVRVEGWRAPAYRHAEVEPPADLHASALLAPFDPVMWTRERLLRLFNFEFRLEVFVPRAKRKWGYYVLPFLFEDRLVGRVDLAADRKRGHLVVEAAYLERGEDGEAVSEALASELWTLAEWLELDEVDVGRRGSLTVPLVSAVKTATA